MSGGARSILRHLSRIAQPRSFAPRYALSLSYSAKPRIKAAPEEPEDEKAAVPTEGINRPLSEVLKKLNMKIPDSLICTYVEKNGLSLNYVPWLVLYFRFSRLLVCVGEMFAKKSL